MGARRGSAELAAEFITEVCRESQIDPKGLVLQSDNGKPMRGSTMVSTLQWLGVVPSFSRPHVSDDNPYSESLFRTLKHTPAYRGCRSRTMRPLGVGSSALSAGTTANIDTARSAS